MGILLVKVAPYGYGRRKTLRYYEGLAAQRISPPLLKEAEAHVLSTMNKKDFRNVRLIICSRKKRSIQTAQIIRNSFLRGIPLQKSNLANEIPFSLKGLDSVKASSTNFRYRFLEDFISDKLLEKRRNIESRIIEILRQVKPDHDVLIVTHTFFMKVFETLVRYPNLFERPALLMNNYHAEKRLFDYCHCLKINNKFIRRVLLAEERKENYC